MKQLDDEVAPKVEDALPAAQLEQTDAEPVVKEPAEHMAQLVDPEAG